MSRATQIDLLLVPLYDYRTNSLCSGYTVNFYAAGTTTPKNVWTEVGKVTPVTTRTLSSSGTVQVYGDGIYKIVVKDTDAATVYTWDYVKAQANTYTVQSKSGTYTATADDDIILVDTTAAGVTINLATVIGFTHPLTVKLAAGANDVTIDGFTTQTIDGALTVTLTTVDDSATLYPDITGETWYRADRLSGLTSTVAELNQLDGVTVGGTTAGDIATINGTQTLTNKTLTSPVINTPTGDVVTLTGTQTLTNKTLTSPKINEDVALTITATNLNKAVTTDGVQTLTNKTLTSPKINEDVAVAATSTEINTACDGILATAAEINVRCDGYPSEYSGSGSGTIGPTLAGEWDAADTIDLGTVTSGDRIRVDAFLLGTKGDTDGSCRIGVQKSSGTATITALHDKTELRTQCFGAAASSVSLAISGTLKVTGSGTLVLVLDGQSYGSAWTIGAGDGQIYAVFEKKQ